MDPVAMSRTDELWQEKLQSSGLANRLANLSFEGMIHTLLSLGRAAHGGHVFGTPTAVRQLCAAAAKYRELWHIARGGKIYAPGFTDDDGDWVEPTNQDVKNIERSVVGALTEQPADDLPGLREYHAAYPDAPVRVWDAASRDVYPACGTMWPGRYNWETASEAVRRLHAEAVEAIGQGLVEYDVDYCVRGYHAGLRFDESGTVQVRASSPESAERVAKKRLLKGRVDYVFTQAREARES